MTLKANLFDTLVPITQFNRGQASRIFDRLHTVDQLIVLKNNQPAAVILSPQEYQRLSEIEENYILLLEVQERLSAEHLEYSSLKEVMESLGISQGDIDSAEDPVLE